MVTILLILSVVVNILFLLPYIHYYVSNLYRRYFDKPFYNLEDEDSKIISSVLKASLSFKKGRMIQQEYKGLFIDLKNFFRPKRNSHIINNFYTAYLYVGLSQYALSYNDLQVVDYLKHKANLWIDFKTNKLNYELKRIDQYPIGILYINLFYLTKDTKYKLVADNIFNSLLAMRLSVKNNIIKYNDELDKYYVDALGMYIPFLMEYYRLTNNSLAKNIVVENLNEYYRWGVDKETGIPTHGYNIRTKMKVGSANWGRGIGWYFLAKAYCKGIDLMDKGGVVEFPYTQFPCSSDHFDSSTAIMIELFKQSKSENSKLSIDFIKKHIRTNGLIDSCSGDTYGFNDYSHSFSESEFCNGLFLLLISKFKN